MERWAAPTSPSTTRVIHVYSNAPSVKLSVNGAAVGTQAVAPFGYATFNGVKYAPGTLSAAALGADGVTILATTSRASFGAPAGLRLSLDVPSPATGTGGALYLDGQDVALVRAEVVDGEQGRGVGGG